MESGEFGADMLVEIHNDGPVTLVLEKRSSRGREVVMRHTTSRSHPASASPRRRQLLEMLGIEVVVRPSHIPEAPLGGETPVAYAERLARDKALAVPGDLVLGADTTVLLDGELLEKPADAEDAVRMLRRLQGRTHEVITSVALKSGRQRPGGHRHHPGHLPGLRR